MVSVEPVDPDYYAVLGVPPNASYIDIRAAYKRAALAHHPDRVPADSPNHGNQTHQFQLINAAYYVLSDPGRRREYDSARQRNQESFHHTNRTQKQQQHQHQTDTTSDGNEENTSSAGPEYWPSFIPTSLLAHFTSATAASQFAALFAELIQDTQSARSQSSPNTDQNSSSSALGPDPFPFADEPTPVKSGHLWSILGAASGITLGFIIANLPGAIAGGTAGRYLGSIRDRRGQSVYDVFTAMPQSERAQVLAALAAAMASKAKAMP